MALFCPSCVLVFRFGFPLILMSHTASRSNFYVEIYWTLCLIRVLPLSEYILNFHYSTKLGQSQNWVPHCFDYLYLAFTGATAFSPTDTMPLSHRAKFLMMIESVLALILIGFVVSRAINII